MAIDWPEVPFPEAIDFQEGPGILAKDFREEGVPLVRLSGLERGGSVLDGANFVDPEVANKRWSHFALQAGDVLLSSSASLGRIAVVGPEGVGAIPYTGIIRMRPRDDRVVAPFIRYLLEAPDFQRQAEIAGVGSVMRHFGPMHLRQMAVRLPPREAQRAIAHILGTLDDRIELNRRMSDTLESIARAFFKSWFVDFDPVRAKAEGRDPGLPSHLADLFPGTFEASEIGDIPAGWEVKPISELGDVFGGSTPRTQRAEYWDGGTHHWVTPKDLSGLATPVLLDSERRITDAGLAQISSGFCQGAPFSFHRVLPLATSRSPRSQ
jgi:type I restriction enzyme S subunit